MYDHCVMVTHKVWMFRRGVNVLFAKLWIRLSNSDLQKQTKHRNQAEIRASGQLVAYRRFRFSRSANVSVLTHRIRFALSSLNVQTQSLQKCASTLQSWLLNSQQLERGESLETAGRKIANLVSIQNPE